MAALGETTADAAERCAIVVIDDDYAMRLSCRQILTKDGLPVATFEDGATGLDAVARLRPGLVIVDLKMPGLTGMEVIARLHDLDPHIVLVVITGYPTIASAVDAIKAGAFDFLPKPFTPDELRLVVHRGLEHRRLVEDSTKREVERELLKRRFVTFVSHQLKTPLVAIHQYLDVLMRLDDADENAQKRQEWYARCLKRTGELLTLIDDWLTLSQVEGGQLSKRREPVHVRQIIEDIFAADEAIAAANRVTLSADSWDSDQPVHGDRNCLSVLFDNLIANAITYNNAGGSVRVTASEADRELTVSVSDTGIGIPEDCLPRLFDEFFRVKGRGGKKTPGSGLGLPICKRIVSEMGGRIDVESTVGVGSTFRVRLPMGQSADDSSRNEP